jgi:hypothetical protein
MQKKIKNNLSGLQPEFLEKVNKLLANCKSKHNIIMVPIQGLRTIEEQAKLWRQGRSLDKIKLQIIDLKQNGAPYLASILEGVGPQGGKNIVTHALPGLSWHNWGYAVDCYVSHEGKLIMENKDPLMETVGFRGYRLYAEEAALLGLRPGYYFSGKKQDRPHVQMFAQEVPIKYTLKMIEEHFKAQKA